MLIITRKDNEAIVTDDTIVITIIEAKHGSTKVGIEAPKDVSITRRELMALAGE